MALDHGVVEGSLSYALDVYRRTARALDPAAGYPRCTDDAGRWETTPASGWTSGFYAGVLWYLYEYSVDAGMRDLAERWTAGLDGQKLDTRSHDVGFQIMCSFGNGYRLTGAAAYKDVILQAARSLATRYNPIVGATQSWSWNRDPPIWQYPVIIDNMMNLELLFWAAKNGGPRELYDVAIQHARTTQRCHVRQDGSTYHVVDFDPATGAVVRGLTWQGYADESAWARGQAWAIYGFTMCHRESGDAQFLATAQRLADYYIDRLPEDHVPYWDFCAPRIPDEERDASAAAIAAAGLLELSEFAPTGAARYRSTAEAILASLSQPPYLTAGTGSDAVLDHSVGSRPSDSEVDTSIIYGDYYYVEALLRYRRSSG
ncbi:MAG: glycoside hydrolase family 88 protein [Anaerolineae bacterium]|nr:glycoside hydrolase family 88 protein [Anaerolineae bacterium]